DIASLHTTFRETDTTRVDLRIAQRKIGAVPDRRTELVFSDFSGLMTSLKSIFLLADSQLLFRQDGPLLLERVVRTRDRMKAAYVGASNGDNPDFYAIFVAAMEGTGIFDCRMIPSVVSEADLAFLNDADIILLAGGDVELGWRTFLANGLSHHIVRRYSEGATLIGISAGAVQLGLCGLAADGSLIETFKLVPFIIGAHEESDNWKT